MVTALLFDLWLLEDECPHPHPAPPHPPVPTRPGMLHTLVLHPPTPAGSVSLAQPRKERAGSTSQVFLSLSPPHIPAFLSLTIASHFPTPLLSIR